MAVKRVLSFRIGEKAEKDLAFIVRVLEPKARAELGITKLSKSAVVAAALAVYREVLEQQLKKQKEGGGANKK